MRGLGRIQEVISRSVGNNKQAKYKEIARYLLVKAKEFGYNLSHQVNYLDLFFYLFLENLAAVAEEQD